MTAALKTVGGKVVQLSDFDPRAPEDLLPHLFAREAALNRELAVRLPVDRDASRAVHMTAHRPIPSAANDRSPRDRPPAVDCFADAIGKSMVVIAGLSLAGLLAALWLDAPAIAFMFTGSMASSSITAILADLFKARLG